MNLVRISLIIAILAGIGGIVVNIGVPGTEFKGVRGSIQQKETDLTYMTNVFTFKSRQLDNTNKVLKATLAELKQTKADLATRTDERDSALKNLEAKTKLAERVTQERDKALKDLDDTKAELASYVNAGLKPEEIVLFKKNYNGLKAALEAVKLENGVFIKKIGKLEADLAYYQDPNRPIPLPASIKGKVLVMDPKWNFVVINVGEDEGVVQRGELLVNRGGKLVAKVKVQSVQKDRCVANIVPGWQLGEVMEGDLVIPAHPQS